MTPSPLLLVAALAGCAATAPSPVASVGPGPDRAFLLLEEAPDLDGRVVGAADDGQPTVAVVFASWCGHCHEALPVIEALAHRHPLRVLGVNYRGHEEYAGRGDAAAVRAFVADAAPWLRVVPADLTLWQALGRPPRVPTIYVFDHDGRRVRTFDLRHEPLPDLAQLEAALP